MRKRAEAPGMATARPDASVESAPIDAGVAVLPPPPVVASPAAAAAAVIPAATHREHKRPRRLSRVFAAIARRRRPDRASPSRRPAGAPIAATAPKVAGDGVRCRAAARPPRADPPWLFGGNTIVKAGVGILFVGLAFLAKYASEHVQLPIEFRLAAIGGAAVVLLGFGWRLRLSRPDYAQVLQGGAVAVLYLTLFAAFRFYSVIAAMPAFVLMVAVAALAAALAVLQDARALAVIGALGGFATPLIVSTGSDNHVALFAYYFVLDLGIAAVAWSKTWRAAQPDRLRCAPSSSRRPGACSSTGPEDYATSQAFLIAFFLLFVVILVLPARRLARAAPAAGRRRRTRDAWVNSSLLFGLPTVTFALEYGLVRAHAVRRRARGARARRVLRRARDLDEAAPRARHHLRCDAGDRDVFLTLVIPFALDARSTAGAWTLEGAGLVWIGFRQQRGLPRLFGYVLLGLAGLAMLLGHNATARRRASSTPISSTA